MCTIWLGVDMGKGSFVAAVCADDEVVLGSFSNDPSGFAALAQQLASCATAADLHLVVEPTSGYELALVAFAYEQDWQVSLPRSAACAQLGQRYGPACQNGPAGCLAVGALWGRLPARRPSTAGARSERTR